MPKKRVRFYSPNKAPIFGEMWFKLVEILNCCKSCQLFLVEFKVLAHKGEKLEAGERPPTRLRLEIVEDSFIDVESKWLLD